MKTIRYHLGWYIYHTAFAKWKTGPFISQPLEKESTSSTKISRLITVPCKKRHMATRTSELTIKDVYKPVRIKWKDRQTIRFFGKQSFHNNNSNNNITITITITITIAITITMTTILREWSGDAGSSWKQHQTIGCFGRQSPHWGESSHPSWIKTSVDTMITACNHRHKVLYTRLPQTFKLS